MQHQLLLPFHPIPIFTQWFKGEWCMAWISSIGKEGRKEGRKEEEEEEKE
jgi:hypothetical protein